MNVEIIRVDGTREQHEIPKGDAIGAIRRLIGAAGCDTVNLRNGSVMIVDDGGYETEMVDHGNGRFELKPTRARKPVNPAATKLYHSICRPGTTHQIVGDVAIALDEDFA